MSDLVIKQDKVEDLKKGVLLHQGHVEFGLGDEQGPGQT